MSVFSDNSGRFVLMLLSGFSASSCVGSLGGEGTPPWVTGEVGILFSLAH